MYNPTHLLFDPSPIVADFDKDVARQRALSSASVSTLVWAETNLPKTRTEHDWWEPATVEVTLSQPR